MNEMIAQRITVKPTNRSAVTALLAKFKQAGIEPNERKHVFQADIVRDGYKRPSGLGAGIRPAQQPGKRKGGSGRVKAPELEAKHPFICAYCGKPGMAKLKNRMYCADNNNECNKKAFVAARKKAGK